MFNSREFETKQVESNIAKDAHQEVKVAKITLPAPTMVESKNAEAEKSIIDDIMPHELQDICLNLSGAETGDPVYIYPRTTFFKKNHIRMLLEAAEHILWGRADEVMFLLKDNPSLLNYLNYSIETKDPLGRRVKGTLLQIAAAAGDVNLKETKDEKEQGIVELLASLMPRNEVEAQLAAWFPAGWEEINNKRMQRYLNALDEFAESILKTDIPNPNWCTLPQLQDAQATCKPLIDKLREALKPDPNEIVTSGYILDTQVFYKACQLFEDKLNRFGDWFTLKSDMFWVNGFGSLQGVASARDVHVIREGISNVIDHKKSPARNVKNSDNSTYFYSSTSRLGLDFFLGFYGAGVDGRWGAVGWCRTLRGGNLMSNKNSSLGKLMRRPENLSEKGWCAVM